MWFFSRLAKVYLFGALMIAMAFPLLNLFFGMLIAVEYGRRLKRIKNYLLWIISSVLCLTWFISAWMSSLHVGDWMPWHLAYSVSIMLFMYVNLKKHGLDVAEID